MILHSNTWNVVKSNFRASPWHTTPASLIGPHSVRVLYGQSVRLVSDPLQPAALMTVGATVVWNSSCVRLSAPIRENVVLYIIGCKWCETDHKVNIQVVNRLQKHPHSPSCYHTLFHISLQCTLQLCLSLLPCPPRNTQCHDHHSLPAVLLGLLYSSLLCTEGRGKNATILQFTGSDFDSFNLLF